MKTPRKVSLISVWDYPRNDFSAYWCIYVDEVSVGLFTWRAEILSYDPVGWTHDNVRSLTRPADVAWPQYPADLPRGATQEQHEARRKLCEHLYETHPKPDYVLLTKPVSTPVTRDEADTQAQQWVKSVIEGFRRPEPLKSLTNLDIELLIVEFDLARAARDFSRVDRIRGQLSAQGVKLEEGQSIGYAGPTQWKRGGK